MGSVICLLRSLANEVLRPHCWRINQVHNSVSEQERIFALIESELAPLGPEGFMKGSRQPAKVTSCPRRGCVLAFHVR